MNGFGIDIKNNLLDPKHVDNMGQSVWLYMWLVDKMTSVNEKSIGKVLGGKPVKYEEVNKNLGISQDQYTAWIDKLLLYPYIQATRTPHGIIFNVLKAKKRFRKKSESQNESFREKSESNTFREKSESNKTDAEDSTIDSAPEGAGGKPVGEKKQKKPGFTCLEDFFKPKAQPHIQLIGYFFQKKGLVYSTPDEWSAAAKQWYRTAAQISKFEDEKITLAFEKASEWPEWQLSTVLKKLVGQKL